MVAINPSSTDYRANTRAYIQTFRATGEKPPYPDAGPVYSPLIDEIERLYLTFEKKNGVKPTRENVQRMLDAQCKQHPTLEELMAPPLFTLARVEVEDEDGCPELPSSAQLPRELSKSACPWLDMYEQYSRRVSPEGFEDFHVACGLWVLSTVVARRVYVPMGPDGIFPALAIALTARSSLFAKTTTARVALKVLRGAGLHWLLGDDETTPQRLLSDMSGKHVPSNYDELEPDKQELVRLRLSMPGQRGWFYDEFGQIVSAMNKTNGPMADFVGLFRKLDGCPPSHSYSTRSYGQEFIDKPYLAFLASMTPDDIRPFAGSGNSFWGNGFWARFAFITPPMNAYINAPFQLGDIPVPTPLITTLQRLNERLGVPFCDITTKDEKGHALSKPRIDRTDLPQHQCSARREVLEGWERYRIILKELMAASRTHDLDGSYQRLPDKALRIAMLFAVAEGLDYIEMRHWARAQEIAEMFRRNLHRLYSQVNSGQVVTSQDDSMLDYLKSLQGRAVTVREIQQYGAQELRKQKADALRVLLSNLMKSGLVDMARVGRTERYKFIMQEATQENGTLAREQAEKTDCS